MLGKSVGDRLADLRRAAGGDEGDDRAAETATGHAGTRGASADRGLNLLENPQNTRSHAC